MPLTSPIFALVAAVGGGAIGALQYPVLRARLKRAEWWIPASTVSWTLGVTVGLVLVSVFRLDGGSWREGHALVGALTGLIVGTTTGALLWFPLPLRAPQPTGN